MKPTLQVLQEAKQLFQSNKNYYAGSFFKNVNVNIHTIKDQKCFCMLGAILKVEAEDIVSKEDARECGSLDQCLDYLENHPAVQLLAKVISPQSERYDVTEVWSFSDNLNVGELAEQRIAIIHTTFDKAIALELENHA